MNQIELEKIADFFDKDHSGTIDLSEILRVLKGNRRGKYVVQEALSDAEKIENEVCFSNKIVIFDINLHSPFSCLYFSTDPTASIQVYLF